MVKHRQKMSDMIKKKNINAVMYTSCFIEDPHGIIYVLYSYALQCQS